MNPKATNQSTPPKSYDLKATSGFTLIESLVAITILIIGVLGPMTSATRGITDGLYAQNQLIATHLVQEGLEILSTIITDNNKPYRLGGGGMPYDHSSDNTIDINDLLAGLEECNNEKDCGGIVSSDGEFDFSDCSNPNENNCRIAFYPDAADPSKNFYKKVDGSGFSGPIFKRILKVEVLTDDMNKREVLLKSKVEWQNRPTASVQIIELSRYAFHYAI